jgi:hypothetical protein
MSWSIQLAGCNKEKVKEAVRATQCSDEVNNPHSGTPKRVVELLCAEVDRIRVYEFAGKRMAIRISAHGSWHDTRSSSAYWNSPHRFNVVPAGRRSGKTELAKRKLVRRALAATTSWVPSFFAAAPTRDQAKRIYWDDLKALVGRNILAKPPSETEL